MDTEPNDSQPAAQELFGGQTIELTTSDGLFELFLLEVAGSITPGDIDYYSLTANFTGPGISLVDIIITSPDPVDFQMLAIDAETGLVIDFIAFNSGPQTADTLYTIQLESPVALPWTEPRTVIVAVAGGHDLDPAAGNPFGFLGSSDLVGTLADFDGLHYATSEPIAVDFTYRLVQVPEFIPSPSTALLAAPLALFAARRRR